jgi:hypothetical protein
VKRLVFAALLAACPALTASAQTVSPYPAITIPLKIDQVPGKSVWYSTGNPGIPGKDNEGNTSNAGFVVTPGGVVVFDALGTPSLGWALLQQIRKITDQKIRYRPEPLPCRSHLWIAGVQGSHRRAHRRAGTRRRIQG